MTELPLAKSASGGELSRVMLALEVDDCRHGKAYGDLGRDEASCAALATEIGCARKIRSGSTTNSDS